MTFIASPKMKNRKRRILIKKILMSQNGHAAHFFIPKIFFLSGMILIISFVLGLLGVVGFNKIYQYYSMDLPQVSITNEDYPEITRIYDRSGKLLYEDIGDEERIYMSVEKISPQFLKTILIAEDQNFFTHHGIDYWASLRAVWHDIRRGGLYEGASTITQQLARNFFLTKEISFSRKIKEMILAEEIEKKYSKKEILEFYLNKISFGSNIYGIEAASRSFFGKSAQFLTLGESATLALIPRSPNTLSPFKNPEELLKKKDALLETMKEKKVISDDEFEKAKNEKIVFESRTHEISAPHFSFYVLNNLKQIYSEEARKNGLDVVTTIDLNLEEKIEALLKKTVEQYQKPYHINNGAIVVLDAKKGDILAMAGSYDFWAGSYGQHNSALAQRQPGSALKPLIYSLAIQDLGWSSKTILEDKPMDFNGYRPKNFSGTFRGKVNLEAALVNSLNIPAVATLNKIGIQKTVSALENCHLKLNPDAGLSMAIGGSSVSLLDLTSSYTAFTNQGKCLSPNYLIRIKENNGKTLTNQEGGNASQAFDEKAVSQIDSILKKSLGNFPLTKNLAQDPMLKDAGVKTGTSNGPRDLWSIGYNSDIIVGVWLGNNDNALLRRDVYGEWLAVPLWADAMKIAIQNKSAQVVFEE